MRLRVLAVGRLKAGPEQDLVARYQTRAADLGRGLGFSGPDIVELPESRARRALDRQADEATRLADRVMGATIVLDERSPSLTSEDYAGRLRDWRDGGSVALSFVIGGPDGLSDDLRARADLALSFGRATLPHGLVRILVCEGLYRALTILAGHPYHRGEAGGP